MLTEFSGRIFKLKNKNFLLNKKKIKFLNKNQNNCFNKQLDININKDKNFITYMFMISKLLQYATLQSFNQIRTTPLLKFFKAYISYSMFLNTYVFINHVRMYPFTTQAMASDIVTRYKRIFPRKFHTYKYIFELFYNVFKYKSISFLSQWFKNLFKNVNFFKHKFLLFYLRYFFKSIYHVLYLNFNVNGIFLKFHGKIAQAGNSRKKKFKIFYKQIGTSYKNHYIMDKFQLNTFTGVVGCTIIFSYRS